MHTFGSQRTNSLVVAIAPLPSHDSLHRCTFNSAGADVKFSQDSMSSGRRRRTNKTKIKWRITTTTTKKFVNNQSTMVSILIPLSLIRATIRPCIVCINISNVFEAHNVYEFIAQPSRIAYIRKSWCTQKICFSTSDSGEKNALLRDGVQKKTTKLNHIAILSTFFFVWWVFEFVP